MGDLRKNTSLVKTCNISTTGPSKEVKQLSEEPIF